MRPFGSRASLLIKRVHLFIWVFKHRILLADWHCSRLQLHCCQVVFAIGILVKVYRFETVTQDTSAVGFTHINDRDGLPTFHRQEFGRQEDC